MEQKIKRKFFLREFKAISHAISNYDDLLLLFKHISEGLSRTFKVKGCCVMLYDDRENQLFYVASYGITDEYLNKGPIFVNEKSKDYLKGKPELIEDVNNDPRIQYPNAAVKEDVSSIFSFPIKCRKDVVGLIRVYHNKPMKFHNEDIDSICILAQQIGVVIENNGLRNFFEEVKSGLQKLPVRMLKGL